VKASLKEASETCYGLGVSSEVNGVTLVAVGFPEKRFVVRKLENFQFSEPIFASAVGGPPRAPMVAFEFSHDAKTLVATNTSHGCWRDGDDFFVYDTATWKQKASIKHDVGFQFAMQMVFTPDDEFLIAVNTSGVLKILDMKNFKPVKQLYERNFSGFSMGILEQKGYTSVAIPSGTGVILMDLTGQFDTSQQPARPTIYPMSMGVGINIRMHPNSETMITCVGGNCRDLIYTYSVASFKVGKPAVVHKTTNRPQVFSNGICFNKYACVVCVVCVVCVCVCVCVYWCVLVCIGVCWCVLVLVLVLVCWLCVCLVGYLHGEFFDFCLGV